MRRVHAVSLSIAALLTLEPTIAAAQAAPAVVPGQRVQDIDFIAEVLYDSAVNGVSPTVSTPNLRHADFIFQPTINFDLVRPIGRETIYLVGAAGYDFYARDSLLNRENINISPGVISVLGPCQVTTAGNYTRAQRDLSELALTPDGPLSLIEEKNVLQVEQVSGSADCGRKIGFAPTASVSETWIDNSAQIQRFTDARTFSVTAGLAYRRPVLGSIQFFGAHSTTDYPDRAGLASLYGLADLASGFETYSGGVSYSRAIGSRLQGSGSLSYTSLTTNSAAPGFKGLTYSAALSYSASPRLQALVNISRATVPSNRLNSTFAIDEIYQATLNYTLGTGTMWSGGASYARDNYGGGPTLPAGVNFDLTRQTIASVFISAERRITRRLFLGVNLSHLQRDANFPGLSYPETRVGLTARAHF